MLYVIIGVIAAYFLGSIPTGYIFGKVLKKIDIRECGSGNVGATNTFRSVGKIPGIIVLVIDFLKGYVAVTVLPMFVQQFFTERDLSAEYIFILFGAAAISGHIWTVFLNFKGGKGVATTAGVMAGLAPLILLLSFVCWLVIFVIFRYVSLASIIAAITLPFFAVIFQKSIMFVLFASILCIVGVYKHRANIKRLFNGEEKRLL
ncbi:MAG TPA: glycerol-3-phosphate 1-O-acyltransferase PlsY [Candidatus Omnitrophota bacterium]|nr:glycerol-3-phosphate 1-O-acyltransferase PlsY [Candidatus Omnitrophota bacterium]